MSKKVSGILAPITTPFENDEVALDRLRDNMEKYRETDLAGFFALGTNGESKCMSRDERLRVLDVVVQGKADQQIVLAGSGYESTRQTIDFSKKVAEAGADFVSILTPSYFKKRMTDEALTGYYTDVADAIPVPLFAYNAPGYTGITLSPKVIAEISKHPNIAGMKDTSQGNMSTYLSVCSDEFDILSGTVSSLFTAMILGAVGGVISPANAFPDPCCELYEKCRSGDIERARELHFMLFKLNRAVSGSFGVAGVKYAMELGGYHGGDPRKPVLPINAENKQTIKDAVAEAGLLK
jgi:4-hydroxy-2-oxoglutarate aldolase